MKVLRSLAIGILLAVACSPFSSGNDGDPVANPSPDGSIPPAATQDGGGTSPTDSSVVVEAGKDDPCSALCARTQDVATCADFNINFTGVEEDGANLSIQNCVLHTNNTGGRSRVKKGFGSFKHFIIDVDLKIEVGAEGWGASSWADILVLDGVPDGNTGSVNLLLDNDGLQLGLRETTANQANKKISAFVPGAWFHLTLEVSFLGTNNAAATKINGFPSVSLNGPIAGAPSPGGYELTVGVSPGGGTAPTLKVSVDNLVVVANNPP